MGIVLAMWLARLDHFMLRRLAAIGGWLLALLLRDSLVRELDESGHHRHPSHAGPGLWWFTPRAVLISWLIGVTVAAAHRARLEPVRTREVAERRRG
jgi:hypothetical protein